MSIQDPTTLLTEWRDGNRAALDQLFPLVYAELRERAHYYLGGEREGHTLTTTGLVHETYLKLLDVERVRWQDKAHFLAITAMAMRRVLVEYARRHRSLKRGAGQVPVELGLVLDQAASLSSERADQMLALDAALERLARLNERLARMVEMRFFGGMTVEETARALDLAESTVKLDWRKAKAWLYRELAAS